MNLSEHFQRLQARLITASRDEESVLALLYEVYSESNAMYDDEIKAGFRTLYEIMNGMSLREMDKIVYPVCTLCRSHQRTGFVEGVQIGFLLAHEIINQQTRNTPE